MDNKPRAKTSQPLKVINSCIDEMQAGLVGDGPHSLCKLGLTEEQYQKLSNWISTRLTRESAKLAGWKSAALIFHLLVEAARREASGGTLWPIIAQKLPPDIQAEFFVQGQPNDELKRLIEFAARKLKWRHALDEPDLQRWYVTAHLQFGFTYRDMLHNLPEWLAGHAPPIAVDRLLSGPLASSSFQDLWYALKYFRKGWITERQIRSVIGGSSWVLPSWTDEIIGLARARRELDDQGSEPDSPPRTILESPRCEWDSEEGPVFRCEVRMPVDFNPISPRYTLEADGQILATFLRQSDGNYRADQSEIVLDSTKSRIVVVLTDSDRNVQLTQVVECWDPTADVNVFELPAGRRLADPSVEIMSVEKYYVLIANAKLTLIPSGDQWMRLSGEYPAMATLLPRHWDGAQLRLETELGVTVWQPRLKQTPTELGEPPWAEKIQVRISGNTNHVSLGERRPLLIQRMPSGGTVLFARTAGQNLTVKNPVTGELSHVTITPALVDSKNTVQIAIRNNAGEVACIRRRLSMNVYGVALLKNRAWQCITPGQIFTKEECRRTPFRLFLPESREPRRAALFEGQWFVRMIGTRAAPLGNISAVGSRLVIRERRFNDTRDLICIGRGAIDCDLLTNPITSAHTSTSGRELSLRYPLEPSAEHRIVCWPCAGSDSVTQIGPEHIRISDEGRRWAVTCPVCGGKGSDVLALAMKGHWLGLTFNRAPGDFLATIGDIPQSAAVKSAMLRWLRLPVLLQATSRDRPMLLEFAITNIDSFLVAWLTNQGLPDGLVYDTRFERPQIELGQLRDLLFTWIPEGEQAEHIVDQLDRDGNGVPGCELFTHVVDAPLLIARTMRQYLRSMGVPAGGTPQQYFTMLQQQLLRQLNTKQGDVASELLERATEGLRDSPTSPVDERFIKDALVKPFLEALGGRELTAEEGVNLRVAMQVGTFREYLAFCAFRDIQGEFGLQ